jgi:hypothetical protein
MSQNQKIDSQAKAQEILNRERNANQTIMRLKATEESYQDELKRLQSIVEEQFGSSDIEFLRKKYRDTVSQEAQMFSEAEQALAEVEALCADVQNKLNEQNRS